MDQRRFSPPNRGKTATIASDAAIYAGFLTDFIELIPTMITMDGVWDLCALRGVRMAGSMRCAQRMRR
jgi:hypothetical protein